MRALIVADGGFNIDPATAAIGSSIGTAFLAWLGNRLVGKAAIQTAINASFKELMDQMRQELKDALTERDEARGENAHLKAEIRQKDAIIAGFERTTVMPHGRTDP
jgi:hypothetical protein